MKERQRTIHRSFVSVKDAAHKFVYFGLIIAAFALMLLGKADVYLMDRFRAQVIDVAGPVLSAMSRPAATIDNWMSEFRKLTAIAEDNSRLRLEQQRLLQWQATARRLEAENIALRGMLNFSRDLDIGFISARVIADTGGAFARSLLLNVGSNDGVRRGQAVVGSAGLVGRVHIVGRGFARILLLTDLNSRIPVVIESTRVRAILAGDNSQKPGLIHLPPGIVLSPGDRVVTSGHAGVFPPGLPVGVVVSVSDGGVDVRPYAKPARLEYARVVNYSIRGLAPELDLKSPIGVGVVE